MSHIIPQTHQFWVSYDPLTLANERPQRYNSNSAILSITARTSPAGPL